MIRRLSLIIILIIATPIYANSKDKTLPYHVVADQVLMDSQKHVTTYIGNVKGRQGSTNLIADRVITYEDKNNNITKLVAFGKPAKYNTLPDGQKTKLYAEADILTYAPNNNIIKLRGNGHVRSNGRHLKGNKIDYDVTNEQLYSAKHEKAQTTIIIPPTG